MDSEEKRGSIAVLIDADNISPRRAGAIFKRACALGEPILRRAYGMVNCFSANGGWTEAQHQYGIVAKPQVSNVSGKNVADIALVVDAMEILYKGTCDGICIVSNDSDFTALAVKIREAGKNVYGIGEKKAPESFRIACTEFFQMNLREGAETPKAQKPIPVCPRCGGKLSNAWTKSGKQCRACEKCGGMAVSISALKGAFTEDSLASILSNAKELRDAQKGCQCPVCGSVMTLLRVEVGKKRVEVDVCPVCRSVWYDKNEYESLVPSDGALHATISAGKAFRRDMTLTISSDLRSGRRKCPNVGALRAILKSVYHIPNPDINPIVSTLQCQRVISVDKKGNVTICKQ